MQEWDAWFRNHGYDLQYQDSQIIDRHDKTQGRLGWGNVWGAVLLRRAVIERFHSQPADLIHVHSSYRLGLLKDLVLAEAWTRRLRCPIAFHVHFAELNATLPSNPWLKREALRRLRQGQVHLILLGNALREELASEGVAETRMFVLPNFHLGRPATRPEKSAGPPLRLLFLGSLDRRKGFFDLLEALRPLPSELWRLDVGGRFLDPHLEADFERQPKELRQNVCMHGYVTGEQKTRILQAADVLVLPSHGEGMPVVILEAMAYSCAVVTTTVGAIPEVVKDGREGSLVSPGDVEGLRQSLSRLMHSEDELRRLQWNAYNRSDDFSPERFRERLISIYNDILAASS